MTPRQPKVIIGGNGNAANDDRKLQKEEKHQLTMRSSKKYHPQKNQTWKNPAKGRLSRLGHIPLYLCLFNFFLVQAFLFVGVLQLFKERLKLDGFHQIIKGTQLHTFDS